MSYTYYTEESMKDKKLSDLENNKEFLTDAITFLRSTRKGYTDDDIRAAGKEQIVYDILEHFRVQSTNEMTMAKDYYYLESPETSDKDKQAFGRLMYAFDRAKGEGWLDGGGAKIRDGVNEGESIYRCSYPHKIEGEWQHRFNFYQIEEAFEFKNADGELFSSHITAGSLFNNFGDKLGFNGGFDAGKLMGLASYGTIVDDESWYMNFEGVQMTKNSVIIDRLKADYPTFEDRANLAKKLQVETAKHTRHLIKKCLEISPRVVLSGGYFLNCVNNYEYLDLFDDPSNLYIEPNSSDAGTALGIAKLFHYALSQKKTPIPLKTLYMG